ncbi:hypothetical protein DFP73DRAFT_584535 [Morchella snyderi]|nr:hypothetical protein DFP73DRAFT_584535 [Morchella snyderi]
MFNSLPVLLLAILLTFTVPTTAIEGMTICETSSGSPLASELISVAKDFELRVAPGGRGPCIQGRFNDINGHLGCSKCWDLGDGHLTVSICGIRGSKFSYSDLAVSLRRLEGECTKSFGGTRRAGGKWRVSGGQFEILVHF